MSRESRFSFNRDARRKHTAYIWRNELDILGLELRVSSQAFFLRPRSRFCAAFHRRSAPDMELTEALSDLDRRGLALIVRKSGETVYESQDAMLRPLVDCIRTRKEDMKGATVIDKVVGEAAAKLLLYAEVASVYTRVASEGAAAALRSSNVHLETERTVENILRRDKKDICPMEKMSREFLSPEKFYRELCETMCFVQNDRLSISRRP